MSVNMGLLNIDTLQERVTSGEIETVIAGMTDLYGRLVGKRFEADFFLDAVAREGTHACNYLLTVDMEMEPVAGYEFANWEAGYGDFHLVPDLATLRQASWLEKTALVFCDVVDESDHTFVPLAPRSLLRKQIERALDLELTAQTASELEYYLFRDSYRQAAENEHRSLTAAGWYLEDYHILQGSREEDFNGAVRRELRRSGVPVESTKGEWGRGQHEINIRYAEILKMADRHIVLKQCLKEVAESIGSSVTFMAKFAEDQAGSSCHVHLSLWRGNENAFVGDQQVGGLQCSETLLHFVGGWLQRIPEIMVFLAPTVNSYKRYQAGSWAPTRLAWSLDNRTAGVRVVGAGKSLRLECRVPGADCNPYLVYASLLAAGIDGIRNQTSPPDLFSGDVYATDTIAHVPGSLEEAIQCFEKSNFVRQAFGEEVVSHYLRFFQTEQAAYAKAVTDWERKRYFERI